MNRYEAMFIIKPDLSDEEKKTLFSQINDVVTKNNGTLANGSIWAERKKLYSPIKKFHEGLFYLANFSMLGPSIKEIRHAYNLNENILRVLITRLNK